MIPRSLLVLALATLVPAGTLAETPTNDPAEAGTPLTERPAVAHPAATPPASMPAAAKAAGDVDSVPLQAEQLVDRRLEHRRRIGQLENELELVRLEKDIAALQRECIALGVRCTAGAIEPIAAASVAETDAPASDPPASPDLASLPAPPTVVAIHAGRATIATAGGVLLAGKGTRLPNGYAVRAVNRDDVVFEHGRTTYRVPVHWAPRSASAPAQPTAVPTGTFAMRADVADPPPPPPATR